MRPTPHTRHSTVLSPTRKIHMDTVDRIMLYRTSPAARMPLPGVKAMFQIKGFTRLIMNTVCRVSFATSGSAPAAFVTRGVEDYSTVTAERICKLNPEHVEKETAAAASQEATPATCEEWGVAKYSAQLAMSRTIPLHRVSFLI